MFPLRQSTASQEIPLGPFVDSVDGDAEETGLTIANTAIKIWKTGATTLTNKNSGGGTHISQGVYYCVLDATDTDTVGGLVVFVHISGALYARHEFVVYPQAIYDALIAGGSNRLAVNVDYWLGTLVPGVDTNGYPKVTVKAGTGNGELTLASGLAAVNVKQINDSAPAAVLQALALNSMLSGTVDSTAFTPTATQFECDDITLSGTDSLKNRTAIILSGTRIKQASKITAYNLTSGRGHFTVQGFNGAPGNDDTLIVV